MSCPYINCSQAHRDKKLNDCPLFGLATGCSSPLLGVFTDNDHSWLTKRSESAAADGENTNKGE